MQPTTIPAAQAAAARDHGDAPALAEPGGPRLSWRELHEQATEASRALIECRSLTEMFEIQSRLLRGNLQAFLDQSSKIAEIAGRMATRPFEALKQAGEARR